MHYSLIFGHHHAWEDFLVLQNLCIKVHRWPQPFSQSPSLFLFLSSVLLSRIRKCSWNEFALIVKSNDVISGTRAAASNVMRD